MAYVLIWVRIMTFSYGLNLIGIWLHMPFTYIWSNRVCDYTLHPTIYLPLHRSWNLKVSVFLVTIGFSVYKRALDPRLSDSIP